MAVYTKFNKENIEEILSNYSIGKLNSFKGIQEGIENTNYFLLVDNKKYILTVYEKRVRPEDLPFFSELMTSLNKASVKCPIPIVNKQKKSITDHNGKKLMIVTYLEGKAKKTLTPQNCKSVGVEVAKKAGCDNSHLMHSEQEIPYSEIDNCNTIGVSSGASAPEKLVQSLINNIKKDRKVSIQEVIVAEEKVIFKLPKELN